MKELKELNAFLRSVQRERRKLLSEHKDNRRKYSDEDDDSFLCRLRENNGCKTALAQEMGISRQAVTKRLTRIQKERRCTANNVIAALGLLKVCKGENRLFE